MTASVDDLMRSAVKARQRARSALEAAVHEARAANWSWNRISTALGGSPNATTLQRAFADDPVDIFRHHVWVNPFWEDDLASVVEWMGADRVLFGSDWPHIEGLPRPLDYLAEAKVLEPAGRHTEAADVLARLPASHPDYFSAQRDLIVNLQAAYRKAGDDQREEIAKRTIAEASRLRREAEA